MILYQLACDADHRFDSWFRDSAAYDAQVARGLLACPLCGSDKVAKSIMAPAIVAPASRRAPVEAKDGAENVPPTAASPASLLDARQRAIRSAMRAIRAKILTEGQDVGARFPEEARSMHEGQTPVRPIHGRATAEEAKSLIEDGVMILPIPVVPEELN